MSTKLASTAALVLIAVSAFPAGSGASRSKAVVCTARAQDCLTTAEFRALTIRSVGLNRMYGLGE